MAKRLDIVLHSDFAPEACLAKLAEQIDIDQRTLFSFPIRLDEGAARVTVHGDPRVGLVVPPAMLLNRHVLPRLGAALSFLERKHIVYDLGRT